MQLMPGTAADVAKRQDISHHVDWLTDRPSHNLELGRAYMGSLLKRFKGSVALAAAAYNAGPRRVDEWLLAYGDPRTGAISERAFVERIPYTETRLYVQRVMEGMIAYRHRLGFQKSASLSF
jgi:soluble lytic murein transglycosylase